MGRLIIIILFALSGQLQAQDTLDRLRLVRRYDGAFSGFTVDRMGNVYLLEHGTQIKKMSRDGDSLGVFSDTRRYGIIHSIDVSNPLRVLLFYKATSTIVILDRFLAVKNVIELRRHGLSRVRAVATSYDNHFWVFDEIDNQLKKLDENGRVLLVSADLRNVFSNALAVDVVIDDNRSVYLYDSAQGWYVFDYYAAFMRRYPFTGWQDVQVEDGRMMGRADSCLVTARPGQPDFAKARCNSLLLSAIDLELAGQRLYVLYPGRLEVYAAP